MSRIYNGGRQAVYTATAGAMLMQNMALPAYADAYNTVSSGGTEYVSSGGWAGRTIVNALGSQIVSDGGVADHTLISFGGSQLIAGGTAEINAGIDMQLTENLYWYGLGSYEASNKVKGWGVHAGIRYAFGGDKSTKKAKQAKPKKEKKQAVKPTKTKEQSKQKVKPVAKKAQPQDAKKSTKAKSATKGTNISDIVKPVYQSPSKKKDHSFMEEMEQLWRQGK